MPNGFYGSTEEWERMEAPLLQIDDILISFARKHNMHLVKNYHNWPNRILDWSSEQLERSIQITLSDRMNWRTAHVTLFARADRKGKRYLKTQSLKEFAPWEEVRNEIGRLLEEGYAILESWPEGDLQYATDLSPLLYEE